MNVIPVIEAENDWLFLAEGSNNSISQMTGELPIEPRQLNQWLKIIKFRNDYFGTRYQTLICPEKSVIFSDFLPNNFSISPDRPVMKLLNSNKGLLYPKDLLCTATDTDTSYPKTDSHMSDIGASIVAEHVVKSFGLDPNDSFSNLKFKTIDILGDLGMKLTPQKRAANFKAVGLLGNIEKDNGLRNRGRITKHVNTSAHCASHPTLLLFGDSFSGINLSAILCNYFREVHFIHSSSIDYSLVDKLNPDYILCEYAERFLINAPTEAQTLVSLISEKLILRQYDQNMIQEFTASLSKFTEYITVEEQLNIKRLIDSI